LAARQLFCLLDVLETARSICAARPQNIDDTTWIMGIFPTVNRALTINWANLAG
jgi:hypothetical protein